MAECRKHPGIWARLHIHDKGPKEGTYGLYCPAPGCERFCDECEESKPEKPPEKQ
jgi:hypothetical protein